jgi:hypothetical protein
VKKWDLLRVRTLKTSEDRWSRRCLSQFFHSLAAPRRSAVKADGESEKLAASPFRAVFGPKATVRLTGVRLGAYNVWKKRPGANFHGVLDDFRIYRGLLTKDQIRTLANE